MPERFTHDEGKGSLFPNKNKQKDTQPDYTGGCCINGHQYDVSGWKTTSKNGITYMNIRIKEPYERPNDGPPGQQQRPDWTQTADDNPF